MIGNITITAGRDLLAGADIDTSGEAKGEPSGESPSKPPPGGPPRRSPTNSASHRAPSTCTCPMCSASWVSTGVPGSPLLCTSMIGVPEPNRMSSSMDRLSRQTSADTSVTKVHPGKLAKFFGARSPATANGLQVITVKPDAAHSTRPTWQCSGSDADYRTESSPQVGEVEVGGSSVPPSCNASSGRRSKHLQRSSAQLVERNIDAPAGSARGEAPER